MSEAVAFRYARKVARGSLVLLVLCGCGRIGFDPLGDGAADGGDAHPDGAGAVRDTGLGHTDGGDAGGERPDGDVVLLDGGGVPASDAGGGDAGSDPIASIPGLLAWWPLDDASFVGGAVDASGGGRTATCATECPAPLETGRVGGAASFDGSNDRLRVPFDAALSTTTGYTLAVFVYVIEIPSGADSAFAKPYGADTNNSWQLELPGDARFRFKSAGDSGGSDDLYAPAVTGRWVHLAGTWDGAIKRLYVDGIAAGSLAGVNLWDDHDLFIGGDENGGSPSGHFLGYIDDVRLYDRAITPAEIALLAAQ